MSSLAPDNWDLLLTSSASLSLTDTSAATPTAAELFSPSAASSGEFQPFTSIGFALAGGGGGRKMFTLFAGADSAGVCLGTIGSSKFCLKACEHDQISCGVASHGVKKFEPNSNGFYLKENDNKGFIKPELMAAGLNDLGIKELLEQKLTFKEFEMLFEDINGGQKPSWMKNSPLLHLDLTHEKGLEKGDDQRGDSKSLELESPRLSTSTMGIFTVAPNLSFESDDDDVIVDELETKQDKLKVVTALNEFRRRFLSIKYKWTQAFLEVEESHMSVVKDIKTLRDATSTLKRAIGRPEGMFEGTKEGIWAGLGYIAKQFQSSNTMCNSVKDDVISINNRLVDFNQVLTEAIEEHELQTKTTNMKLTAAVQKLGDMEAKIQEYERRFTLIFPLLMDLKQGRDNSVSSEWRKLEIRLQELEQRVPLTADSAWQSFAMNSTGASESKLIRGVQSSTDEMLQDLQSQIHLLNQRVVGGGVQIGTKVFQSFEDVQAWVVAELPNKRYGLFVDAVSLLDFFSFLGHTDNEKQLSAFHNQQRAGFATQYESRVATSIQNLFPHVFGKAGSEESQYLPGVPDPDKWDNGLHGLKHAISKGMGLVETQVENAIHTVLHPYPEAKRLAQECLYKAKRFITELCTFISEDFHNWKARGHGKKDAWRMTSVCVRRVFEEIHAERVIARDGYDHNNIDFTTAKMLWATWKAHAVMDKYMKHQFYEHPSVAAVLARHLADNYVKPDDSQGAKITLLEKNLKTLTSQVERLISADKENRGGRPKQDKQPKGGKE